MSMYALRPALVVDVVSPIEPIVVRQAQPPQPDVGVRWGGPSSFVFEGGINSSRPEDAGGGVTVEWPEGGRPSRPRNEKLVFTGVIVSPAYIKVRAPDDDESWGIISVPNVITFTNVQTNPATKIGKLKTTFELRFKLHPEGEASTPDGT